MPRSAAYRRLLSRLLDLLSPRTCVACDRDVAAGGVLCAACSAHADLSAPAGLVLDGIPTVAAVAYAGPLADAIQRFKYGARPDLAAQLALLAAAALGRLHPEPGSVLVPVPLHPRRLAERGYNQSALLAKQLARRHGLGFAPLALRRLRATEHQVGRTREQRWSNVTAAFAVRDARALARRQVVLVDDVVTTGATATACIRSLSAASARVAGVVALARAGH